MPTYVYTCLGKYGNKICKTVEAESKGALSDYLSKSGNTVISIEEKKTDFSFNSFSDFLDSMFSKVKVNHMVTFLVQLSSMLDAGIPLPAALETVGKQTENKILRNAILDVTSDIKGGSTFSQALSKYRNIFNPMFINLISTGEASGNLDEILKRLANFSEREAELKQRISSATFYPLILVVAGTGVIIFVIMTVIPPFARIFTESGVPLPLPTLVLYTLSQVFSAAWFYILPVIIAAYFGFKYWAGSPQGKPIVDNALLNLPLWGNLIRKVEIARLSRTLAALLQSGVPMIRSLELTQKTVSLTPISDAIGNALLEVNRGKNMSTPLRDSKQFTNMAIYMVAVGEETGTIEAMLNKVADFYDMETDFAIKKLTSMLEPIFLVVIGGMVAFIFASILLPIFNMVKAIKRL